jgi:phage tail tape-measure protein
VGGACATGTPRIKCGPHHPTAAPSEQANTEPTRKEQEMTGSTPAKRVSWRGHVAARSLALVALVALAGCGSTFGNRANSFTCPAITTVPDLQTLVQVVPGANGATVQSSGRIGTVAVTCDREGENGVVASVTLEFAVLRTTPAVNGIALPYFVALADSTGNILGKQQFTITINFDPNAPVAKAGDAVTVHIPLKNAQLANIYTLVVGFQLNEAQLDYNRAHLQ